MAQRSINSTQNMLIQLMITTRSVECQKLIPKERTLGCIGIMKEVSWKVNDCINLIVVTFVLLTVGSITKLVLMEMLRQFTTVGNLLQVKGK